MFDLEHIKNKKQFDPESLNSIPGEIKKDRGKNTNSFFFIFNVLQQLWGC